MADGLTIKQDRFARQYVKDGNGTRAAKMAGYAGNENALAVAASRDLLRNPKVSEAIKALRKRQQERLDVSREKMINDVAHFAEQAAVKEEYSSAIKATELIMKAQGYLVERSLNVSVDVTQNHLDALMQYTDQRVDEAVKRAQSSSVSGQHAPVIDATDIEEQPSSADVHTDLS